MFENEIKEVIKDFRNALNELKQNKIIFIKVERENILLKNKNNVEFYTSIYNYNKLLKSTKQALDNFLGYTGGLPTFFSNIVSLETNQYKKIYYKDLYFSNEKDLYNLFLKKHLKG